MGVPVSRQLITEIHRFGGKNVSNLDVTQPHQLIPRCVAPQKRPHSPGAVDGHIPGVNRLEAEERQAQVMSHVGVGQKNAVHRRPVHLSLGPGADVLERVQLPANVRGGVQQIDAGLGGQADRKARDPAPERRIFPGCIAPCTVAGGVGESAVLHGSQDPEERTLDGF